MSESYTNFPEVMTVFSANWCPDCKRTKNLLDSCSVHYHLVDIGRDNDAFLFIEKLTKRVKIPTIIFPDGAVMIEPSNEALIAKLESLNS